MMKLNRPRQLKHRLIVQITFMLLGLLCIAGGAVWGINGLRQDYGVALRGYRQLREVYEIGVHVAAAKDALDAERPNLEKVQTQVQAALTKLELFTAPARVAELDAVGWLDETMSAERSLDAQLHDSLTRLSIPSPLPSHNSIHAVQLASLTRIFGTLAEISSDINRTISAKQQAAEHRGQVTLIAIALLATTILIAAVVNGLIQYRGVIRPLAKLRSAARRIARGRFTRRIGPLGCREFDAVADDFNTMAAELDGLYGQLERRVRAQSKALVQSERLASVGYLAAGVAHEINNPLGIIAGYGERSLLRLRKGLDPSTARIIQGDLEVMCDEAFRCKRITDRLLSLARSGGEGRAPVSMSNLAEDVVSSVAGLRRFSDRRLVLRCDSGANLDVFGRADELKQIILNFILNALDAVPSDTGFVQVHLRRVEEDVEMTVSDNGRGMTPQTIDRVFEPFYSERRGERPGTGLGLSITHAIVSDHGGVITAESAGIERGSQFTVRLPCGKEIEQHAND